MGNSVDAKKLHHSCSTFWLACDSILQFDMKSKRAGEIKQAIGDERFAMIEQMRDDCDAIISAILKQPYQTTPVPLERHEKQMLDKWNAAARWFDESLLS
jgi:hypothetical protein